MDSIYIFERKVVSDRQIAAARIMGRRPAARLRELGTEHHWLDVAGPMPADEAIAAALGQPKRASTTVSSLAAQRERIQSWAEQGVSGVAIFAALQREQGWSGSYSAVRRIPAGDGGSPPVRLQATSAHGRHVVVLLIDTHRSYRDPRAGEGLRAAHAAASGIPEGHLGNETTKAGHAKQPSPTSAEARAQETM